MLLDSLFDAAVEAAVPALVAQAVAELEKADVQLSPEQLAALNVLVRDVLVNAKDAALEFASELTPEQVLKLAKYLLKSA